MALATGSKEELAGGEVCGGSRVPWGQGQSCSGGSPQAREAAGTRPCLLPVERARGREGLGQESEWRTYRTETSLARSS